jgi:hypothetical protein
MTIALGLIGTDGMIVAADTEVGTETEKLEQGKVFWMVRPHRHGRGLGSICITGAGDLAYLRALQSDIGKLFLESKTESMDDLGRYIAALLKTFYKEHIVSLSPHPSERPDVSLIIAARQGIFWRMWVTSRNRLSTVEGGVAVGLGGTYADLLLGRLSLPHQMETGALIAAFIVYLVKDRIPWCGKSTTVFCIGEDLQKPLILTPAKCRRLEDIFREYLNLEARIVHRVFGADFADPERLSRDIEILRQRTREVFHPSSEITSSSDQT